MGAARSRANCAVYGQTLRQTLVVTTDGSRIPARSVVASSMHLTLQVGRQGSCAVGRRSACSKVWMQLRQTVPKNKSKCLSCTWESIISEFVFSLWLVAA